MMNNLIFYTGTATNVQRYIQSQIGNIVQTKIQSIEQFVRFYVTSLFYRSLNNTPFKVILCTFISGKTKIKNNSYFKAGDSHA